MRRIKPLYRAGIQLALVSIIALGLSRCDGADPASPADRATFERLFAIVADVPLGDPTDRFDYQSFDPISDRLYIAKMGSGRLLVFDVHSQTFEEIRQLLDEIDINRLTPVEAL